MTREELRAAIIEEIGNIAPEADAAGVAEDADLREALDLDSMDIFNLVVALSKRLGVDIPDAEAGRLVTLRGGVEYLARLLAVRPPSPPTTDRGCSREGRDALSQSHRPTHADREP